MVCDLNQDHSGQYAMLEALIDHTLEAFNNRNEPPYNRSGPDLIARVVAAGFRVGAYPKEEDAGWEDF